LQKPNIVRNTDYRLNNMLPKKATKLRFEELDGRIKRNLIQAGEDLVEIQEKELFREGGFSSMAEYCISIGKNYHWAWRQMKAAEAIKTLPKSTEVKDVATALAVRKIPLPIRRQVVKAIEDTFEDFSTTRAELIAQTEMADAYNEGRDAIAREAGLDEKSWETESGDPCPICEDNEAEGWIDIDDDFSSGDDAPTAHPNCLCILNFRKSSE